MNGHDQRNDWSLIAAIAIIAVGVWFLLGNIFGPAWREAIQRAFHIAWPLALIALGVLLYLASTRGASRPGAQGSTLVRSRSDRMIGGVLGGVGAYFGIDPTVLRVLYAVFALLTGLWPAGVVYVIAMIAIPEEPAGAVVEPPSWPQAGSARVEPSERPSSGWPHTGRETVQTPPPPPPAAPGEEPPPSAEGPAQS